MTRRRGQGSPLESRAARTRSRDSRTAASGRPTMVKPGRPLETWTSTETDCPRRRSGSQQRYRRACRRTVGTPALATRTYPERRSTFGGTSHADELFATYRTTRARMTRLAADLSPLDLCQIVPACPLWTVFDLIAHVVSMPAAIALGASPRGSITERLQDLVEDRRSRASGSSRRSGSPWTTTLPSW